MPGKSLGQRCLEGYNPRGHKESDTTKVTDHACIPVNRLLFTLLCVRRVIGVEMERNKFKSREDIPVKIPAGFLIEIDKLILKSIRKHKRSQITRMIFRKNKVEGLKLPDCKSFHKGISINSVLYWQKDRINMDL